MKPLGGSFERFDLVGEVGLQSALHHPLFGLYVDIGYLSSNGFCYAKGLFDVGFFLAPR